jgi:hypothetical protein
MAYKPTGNKPGRPRTFGAEKERALQLDLADFKRNGIFKTKASPRAQKVGVKRQTVHRWRKDPHYLNELTKRFAEEIYASLRSENLSDTRKRKTFRGENRTERFEAYVTKFWNGSVRSPLNGKLYRTPKAYIEHVRRYPSAQWTDWGEEMRLAVQRECKAKKEQDPIEGVTVEWVEWEDPDPTR